MSLGSSGIRFFLAAFLKILLWPVVPLFCGDEAPARPWATPNNQDKVGHFFRFSESNRQPSSLRELPGGPSGGWSPADKKNRIFWWNVKATPSDVNLHTTGCLSTSRPAGRPGPVEQSDSESRSRRAMELLGKHWILAPASVVK